jgi:type II secretory pathway component GspD/PulD (secretin)
MLRRIALSKNNLLRRATAIIGLFLLTSSVHSQDIPWPAGKTMDLTTVEQPVQDVIRQIIDNGGFSSIFRPGISGDVTFEFSAMPLRDAFRKVIEENGLSWNYNAQAKIITIFPIDPTAKKVALVSPENLSLRQIQDVVKRFGLGDEEVEILADANSRSLFLRGPQQKLSNITKVLGELDQAEGRRRDKAKEQHAEKLLREQAELEQRVLRERLNAKTVLKVIPLRYANVGSSKTTFQGVDIQVPGIDETLKALLDLQPQTDAAGATSSTLVLSASPDTAGINPSAYLDLLGSLPGRPQTRVSIDQRTNSVIVRGDPKAVEEIAEIIKRIDLPVPLIDIEVMIVEAVAGTSKALGVQWALGEASRNRKKVAGVSTGGTASGIVTTLGTQSQTAPANPPLNPLTLLPLSSVESGVASFILNASGTFISAQLNVLAAQNKAQIISQPHLVTLNNVPAKITDNGTVHVRIATEAGGAGDIEAIKAGLSIAITPSVVPDEITGGHPLVRLTIEAQNSSFQASALGEVATQEKEIQTQVVLRDQATFVMGGLFKVERDESEDGIPGLKDLPFLGALFRDRASSDRRTETIFFITPRIVSHDTLASQEIGREFRTYTKTQQDKLHTERDSLRAQSQLIDLKRVFAEDE